MSTAATLRIDTPRVFLPLLEPHRYKGARGGRGSGKSWFFAELLVERFLLEPNTRWVCVREIQKTLDQSVKRLLEDTIQRMDVGRYFNVLNTHIEVGASGHIAFIGMQNHNAESIKSLEGYHGAWVEEAQTFSQRSLDLLRPTIRAPHSEIWFSWNPRYPTDPVDDFFCGKASRKPGVTWAPPPDSALVTANFTELPWFPNVLRKEMEWDRARDPEKYAHVWKGDYQRNAEARVFRNWKEEAFETPSDAVFHLGADWGFSIDPTVLVRCFIKDRTLYIDREAWQIGCEIDKTPALFDALDPSRPTMARHWTITGDSESPATISYLQRHGYPRLMAAKKGPGSVVEGVNFLQTFDIVVHPRCSHVIDELTHYAYKTDPLTDTIIPELEDTKNHTIDALRYAVESVRRKRGFGEMDLPGW